MSEDSGGQRVASLDHVPVIFAFQPTRIVPVDVARLGEWERAMLISVGLGQTVESLSLKAVAGGSCMSWCGGQTPEAGNLPDDCDQL